MAAKTDTRIPLLELKGQELTRALGSLRVTTPSGQVSLPLSQVDIKAQVVERIAEVTVTQVFRNTYADFLEAVYVFPLAGGSAVSHFELRVKDRIIVGKVEERAEARRQYKEAIQEGKRAALMEKERDDIFTVQVGNLPPGEEATVRLVYSECLPFFEDGTTEIRLPLVVAPRYIPGAPLERDSVGNGVEVDTNAVPDASRISPPRLADGFDPKVGLGIRVELLPDMASTSSGGLAHLFCSQHATRTSTGNGSVIIELSREDERLNRDFILRWRLAGEKVCTSFLAYTGEDGHCYGMVSLIPPHREGFLGIARDIVFVLDRSGSMMGVKMASAARACSLLLATLEPRDRFAIQAFDDRMEWMSTETGDHFIQANESGVEQGNRYLRQIDSRGGTELNMALTGAITEIQMCRNQQSMPVIVLITDGQIGDEGRVLKQIQQQLGDARVFTVGIDTAVNEAFLKRLANLGGGTSTFVAPGENLEYALRAIGREIGSPLVIDVSVESPQGIEKGSISPEHIPDLFSGRGTTAYFRMKKAGMVRVKGKCMDGTTFKEELTPQDTSLKAISHLWARTRIADLEDHYRLQPQSQEQIKKQIIGISKAHTILTRFTAFIVVDESEIVNTDGSRRTVMQPVEKPDMWDMDMSFGAAGTVPMGSASYLAQSFAAPMQPGPLPKQATPVARGMKGDQASRNLLPKDGIRKALMARKMASSEAAAPGAMPPIEARPMPRSTTKSEAFRQYKDIECEEAEAPSAAPPPAMPAAYEKRKRTVSPAKKNEEKKAVSGSLARALAELEKLLKTALEELKNDSLPDAVPLEKARASLMKELAESESGTELPKLQRFLRVAAIELISALKTQGVTAASLVSLFEKHLKDFEEARTEASGNRNPAASQEEPFWESTI